MTVPILLTLILSMVAIVLNSDYMEPFCSVCGTHNDSTNDQNMRYCPHCWAKMDGFLK